jgi:hypothetical protein
MHRHTKNFSAKLRSTLRPVSMQVSQAQLPSLPHQLFNISDTVTLNAQFHSFIDTMQHLNLACVVIKCGMELCSLLINKTRLRFINIRTIVKCE